MSTSTILTGVTCLVTGGASGLGKVIATSFLKAGASVAICDIQEDRVLQMKEELAGLGALLALSVDITNPSAAQDMFTKITDTFGTLDVLVNNAGIMDRFDPVADLDPKLWDRVMSVNLTAPFMLTKLALGIMLQKQPSPTGCIINIASGAAKAGWLAGKYLPSPSIYSSSGCYHELWRFDFSICLGASVAQALNLNRCGLHGKQARAHWFN